MKVYDMQITNIASIVHYIQNERDLCILQTLNPKSSQCLLQTLNPKPFNFKMSPQFWVTL